MEVELEATGREVIKPSSPAPHDRLHLSLLDLSCPAIYVATTFFYKSIAGEPPEIISRRLKTSLSETLSRFYPLAGRQEGTSVCCNDEGVVFTEARTDLLLSDFLRDLNTDSLAVFLAEIEQGESAGTWPLLRVKLSFFGSGSGVAVTVGISHQICDAASLLTFVQGWAATTKGTTTSVPQFAGTTIYPPPYSSIHSPSLEDLFEVRGKCVTNRLVFKSSKIAELKRKAASESVREPTRVEAISSLIWRCATNASRSNSVSPKSTLMTQSMDLRLRIPSSVLPIDSIGNLQSCFFLKKEAESELEIDKIVAEFRKTKEGFNEMIKENLQGYDNDTTITTTTLGQNLLSSMGGFLSELKPDIDLYTMSSWCKKPFYEVDFGWGNPVWMGPASHTVYNNIVFVVLMDSKDGEDVEAWVGLPKQDSSAFLCDEDLLAYAVLNPPVLIWCAYASTLFVLCIVLSPSCSANSKVVYIVSKKTMLKTKSRSRSEPSQGENDDRNSDLSKFEFDSSHRFISGTFIMLVKLVALVSYLVSLQRSSCIQEGGGSGLAEACGCILVGLQSFLQQA